MVLFRLLPARFLIVLNLLSLSPLFLFAEDPGGPSKEAYGDKNGSVSLDIECHSGTPLVLEFVLRDPQNLVRRVLFDFDRDGNTDLAVDKTVNETVFRGIPYREAGVYRPLVKLETDFGVFERSFVVAFADFVWGRDNYSFANDGQYEDYNDFVSERLIEWAGERFEPLDGEEEVLLLSSMYDLYKGSIGRCYGFTGGQIYYLDDPERFPEGYGDVYELSELNETVIRAMDYVQNDIVFANFISGRIRMSEGIDPETLANELGTVRSAIDRGRRIIIGYLSKKMHHSMVVYGYFDNEYRSTTTLLTANNWERGQDSNIFSEDAENIVVDFSADHIMKWYDLTKKKYRYPLCIFTVNLEKKYDFDHDMFSAFLRGVRERVARERKTLLIVEKTEIAYVTGEDGEKRGYQKPRYFQQLDEIGFKKVDYNFVFKVPMEGAYTLTIGKRRYNKLVRNHKKVNLYALVPDGDGVTARIFRDLDLENGNLTIEITDGALIFPPDQAVSH